MAKRKLTALQKRRRKEAERRDRARYEATKRPPSPIPAEPRARADRAAVKAAAGRTAEQAAKLSKAQLAADVSALWDKAYSKYRRLMAQGTPNAATAIYEQNFAGMNPERNSMNKNRALLAQLKNWLKRKDTSATKAKKAQRKTLDYLKKHGFPDISSDEMTDFWDMYDKYLEYTGGIPQGAKKYIESFASAYQKYRDDPAGNMQEMFEDAKQRMYAEYENTFDPSALASSPLDL